MAEPVNGGSNNQAQPPKEEMSMEVRLLIAFVLMGAVMFAWQFLYKPEPPPSVKKAAAPAQTTPATDRPSPAEPGRPSQTALPPSAPPPADAAQTAAPSSAPTSRATAQRSEPFFVVNTNLYKVTFSNQGATVRSWILKKYHGNDEKPLDLANASTFAFPFSLYFTGQKPTTDVNWAWYTQTPDPDGLGVTYKLSDGHTTVSKVFHFQKNSYLSTISCEVSVDGKPVPSMVQ
ncbi:MAG TPA: membrane protein insertase YidC, partial [Candidatus Solibacter sp.]|nr:membrane protein insertase YidC [Candidatus Solibacter sp.]